MSSNFAGSWRRAPIFQAKHLWTAVLAAALVVALAVALTALLTKPAHGQASTASFSGDIDATGHYHAPPLDVVWTRAGNPPPPARVARLDPDVSWDGSNSQGDPLLRWRVAASGLEAWGDSRAQAVEAAVALGVLRQTAESSAQSVPCIADQPGPQCQADPRDRPYICRYGGCDSSLLGRQIRGVGAEQASQCMPDCSVDPLNPLLRIFRQRGIRRAPSRMEWTDFLIANPASGRYFNACTGKYERTTGLLPWQHWERLTGECHPDHEPGWQSTLGPSCWSACATPDGLPPAIGPGPSPTPTPTATPRPTPCPCGASASGAGGVQVCNDCPQPAATPTPRPTPQPTATPCPSPPPCPTCPPAVQTERMPVAVRATINKGLSSLGRQWQRPQPGQALSPVAQAMKWLDEHPMFVPGSRTSGQLSLYLDDCADCPAAWTAFEPRGCAP